MITEDYVSYETAKLLKKKGFDEPTGFVYSENGELMKLSDFGIRNLLNSECDDYPYWLFPIEGVASIILAPTIQMAMKWLREVHKLHCNSDYDIILGWYCQITSLTETVEYDYEEMKHYHPDNDHGFSSAEEACEAAIKYILENLI